MARRASGGTMLLVRRIEDGAPLIIVGRRREVEMWLGELAVNQ